MGPVKNLLVVAKVEGFPTDRADFALVEELPRRRAIEDLEYEHAEDRLAYGVFVVLGLGGDGVAIDDVANLVLGDAVEFTEDVCKLVAPEDHVVCPFVCGAPLNAREINFVARDNPVVQLVEHMRDFEVRVPNRDTGRARRSP